MEMKNYSTLTRLLLAAICSALPLAGANAGTILFDGILDAGDTYDNSFQANWHNEHKNEDSIYGDGTGSGAFTYEVKWTQDEDDADNFYLYLAMPLYAKNMIFGDNVPQTELDTYDNHWLTHHSGTFAMDFKTATDSEKIVIAGITANMGGKSGDTKVVSADSSLNLIGDVSSLDYLLGGSTPICSIASCSASDIAFSFELHFALSGTARTTFLVAIQDGNTQMHLSPERGLLPAVPLPAAAWLFGSVLLGFGALKRKKA
jgi:hypothetical protein